MANGLKFVSTPYGFAVMSSHDSVSMVLKCMLKGAADFLIKPVRKNELRNLWQHVWRRHAVCHVLQFFSGNLLIFLLSVKCGLTNLTYIYFSFLVSI